MKNKIVLLDFDDKTLTGVAGYDYGKEIFEKQVSQFFDKEKNITIQFPEQIERIAISFVQGFTKEPFEKYGREKALEKMEIIGKERVVKKFYAVV